MEDNILRLQALNKLVTEARKRVEYLKERGLLDVQTWMLNNLVDDACCDLKEIRRLRNN